LRFLLKERPASFGPLCPDIFHSHFLPHLPFLHYWHLPVQRPRNQCQESRTQAPRLPLCKPSLEDLLLITCPFPQLFLSSTFFSRAPPLRGRFGDFSLKTQRLPPICLVFPSSRIPSSVPEFKQDSPPNPGRRRKLINSGFFLWFPPFDLHGLSPLIHRLFIPLRSPLNCYLFVFFSTTYTFLFFSRAFC